MILDCPFCAARYDLPESLMGPAGARVRCPACARSFAVDHEGRRLPETPAGAGNGGDAGAEVRAREVARTLVAGLVERSGASLRSARDRGRLFAEWGPLLFDLLDEYRRHAGPGAGPEPFRRALRDQLGIELGPPEDPAPPPAG